MQLFRVFLLLMSLVLAIPAQSYAQDKSIDVELNAADTIGEGCRLSFLLRNRTDVDVESLVVETVLFSSDQRIHLLTLFDFGALPTGRTRVRQFQVPGATCDGLSMVLLNGADTCTGQDLTPAICDRTFAPASRVDIKLEV